MQFFICFFLFFLCVGCRKQRKARINNWQKKGRTFLIFLRNAEQQRWAKQFWKSRQDRSIGPKHNTKALNQETGKQKSHHEALKSLCSQEPNMREDAAEMRAGSPRFGPVLPSSGACGVEGCTTCTCGWSKGGGENGEEEEEGRKREVSSINGLPFCSPARPFAFFIYRFWYFISHFRGCNDPVPW